MPRSTRSQTARSHHPPHRHHLRPLARRSPPRSLHRLDRHHDAHPRPTRPGPAHTADEPRNATITTTRQSMRPDLAQRLRSWPDRALPPHCSPCGPTPAASTVPQHLRQLAGSAPIEASSASPDRHRPPLRWRPPNQSSNQHRHPLSLRIKLDSRTKTTSNDRSFSSLLLAQASRPRRPAAASKELSIAREHQHPNRT